ncbi:MAG TPA: hypothetical protein VGK13_04140 [Methanocellaceae archaeon]|jgi:hypothetical protein
MDPYAHYALEFVVILVGITLIHKYIFNHNRTFDSGSFYLSIMGAVYVWTVVVSMHMFGISLGFILGIIGGALAVMMLDTTAGILYRSGY